ncbi:MAG: hypothetical protein M1816_004635 [Peltula sp. TS41687]|nr:MAG: hypothetical protein M1816_004635 [Peltula sp. TS41687]
MSMVTSGESPAGDKRGGRQLDQDTEDEGTDQRSDEGSDEDIEEETKEDTDEDSKDRGRRRMGRGPAVYRTMPTVPSQFSRSSRPPLGPSPL